MSLYEDQLGDLLDDLEGQGMLLEAPGRAFMLACCDLIFDSIPAPARAALEVARRFADGHATASELERARVECWDYLGPDSCKFDLPRVNAVRAVLFTLDRVWDDSFEAFDMFIDSCNAVEDHTGEQIRLISQCFGIAPDVPRPAEVTMDNKDTKRGFAGLVDLASDLSRTDDFYIPEKLPELTEPLQSPSQSETATKSMSVILEYEGEQPAWRISMEKPLSFSGVRYELLGRLFRLPQGALFAILLNLYDIPDQPYYVHRVLSLEDRQALNYLNACVRHGSIVATFRPAEGECTRIIVERMLLTIDGELRLPEMERLRGWEQVGFQCPLGIDAQVWKRSLEEGLRYNEGITVDGDRALRDFLDVFNPAFQKIGARAAWDEVERRCCSAEAPLVDPIIDIEFWKQEIEDAIEVFLLPEIGTDGEVQEALVAKGIERETAKRLSYFIPSAFAKASLANYGLAFPDHYKVMSDPELTPREYAKEPIYCEALEAARQYIDAGNTDTVDYLVAWSAEGKLVAHAIQKGEDLSKVKMHPIAYGM